MAVRGQGIAQERIEYLHSLAQRWANEDRLDDARTAIRQLRALAQKHTITTPAINKTICKECYSPLIPGKSARVRVKNDMRVITCEHCSAVKRLGLT